MFALQIIFQMRTLSQRRASMLGLGLIATVAIGSPAHAIGPFECVVKPSMLVNVSAPISGVMASIAVDRGARVRRGQPIAALDASVEQATVDLAAKRADDLSEVLGAEARIDMLRKKQERGSTLNRTRIVSDQALDEIESELKIAEQSRIAALFKIEIAKLELERARAQLRQRTVVSPVDGIVTQLSASPGEFVNEQKPVMAIAQVDPLYIETFVPIAHHGTIRLGDSAFIQPAQPTGSQYPAVVDVVDRVYDAASDTFGVRLRVANADFALPSGVRCRVSFGSEPIAAAPRPAQAQTDRTRPPAALTR